MYAFLKATKGWRSDIWNLTSSSRAIMSRSCWLSGQINGIGDPHPAVDIAVKHRRLAVLIAHMDIFQPVQVVPAHEFHVARQERRDAPVIGHQIDIVAVADVLADLNFTLRFDAGRVLQKLVDIGDLRASVFGSRHNACPQRWW